MPLRLERRWIGWSTRKGRTDGVAAVGSRRENFHTTFANNLAILLRPTDVNKQSSRKKVPTALRRKKALPFFNRGRQEI